MSRQFETTSSRFLPLGVDLRGRRCVVVGGGAIGSRKVATLLRAAAAVVVVSPEVTEELASYAEAGRIVWIRDRLREEHLEGAFMVVAATSDHAVNEMASSRASESGALVCDASSAERSQVIFGALFEDRHETVAVFTDGRDPARARAVRDRIAEVMSRDRIDNE